MMHLLKYFFSILALKEGHVQSSVELIKSIQKCSREVKAINLRAMVTSVTACYDALSETIDSTASIVSVWLDEVEEAVATEANVPYFLAMTMRSNHSKDWFRPRDKGYFYINY